MQSELQRQLVQKQWSVRPIPVQYSDTSIDNLDSCSSKSGNSRKQVFLLRHPLHRTMAVRTTIYFQLRSCLVLRRARQSTRMYRFSLVEDLTQFQLIWESLACRLLG